MIYNDKYVGATILYPLWISYVIFLQHLKYQRCKERNAKVPLSFMATTTQVLSSNK
jgi:hypothetical protein